MSTVRQADEVVESRPGHVVRVVLVDDHDMMRQGARQALQHDDTIKVVGEASSLAEAVEVITREQPDVLVVDIRLQDGSGLDVVKAAKRVARDTKTLVLSAYDDLAYVKPMLKMGVRGYLVKTVSGAYFRQAVHDVASGNLVFPREVAEQILGVMKGGSGPSPTRVGLPGPNTGPPAPKAPGANPAGKTQSLTSRESQVLNLLHDGMSNREIAQTLGISPKTVEAHIQHLLMKLGVFSRTQAVVRAMKRDML